MSERDRVVIAGGGVAGCAVAYYLSAAGVPVTVVERADVGAQASAWSAGGINPLHGVPAPVLALAMESCRLHLALWPELQRRTGIDFAARRIAMALLAPDAAAVPPLLALGDAFRAAEGFSARWLDAAAFGALEPRLTAAGAGALLTGGNGALDSHRFTQALAAAARLHGARIHQGAVSGVEGDGRRLTAVRCGADRLPCAAAVFALGPWSQGVAAWLGVPLPIEPLKGEILRLAVPDPPLPFDVVSPAVSLFVRPGGRLWLGATSERRGFDTRPTESARRTLMAAALRLMPSLEAATLERQTACLRPVSPDGLPLIGAVPGWDNAYVAGGGGPKGILLAPAMGRAVADLILGGRSDLSIESSAPARFSATRLT